MESNIRALAHGQRRDVVAAAYRRGGQDARSTQTTPESYVGYEEAQYAVGTALVHDKPIVYKAPNPVPINTFAFDGTWTDDSQEATAGSDAQLYLHFVANDVYLVMGGTGTVDVSFNGRHLSTIEVSGVPRLYTLFSGNALQTGQLDLRVSPGVQAYDFTFG